MSSLRRFAPVFLAIAAFASSVVAQASLAGVTSTTRQISGKAYYEVTATMNGPPSRPYVVPILLLYPVNPSENNDTAIVDLLNQTPMALRAADTGGAEYAPAVPMGRVLLGDDFIARFGYAYAAIQWDREMIPFINFHEGTSYSIPTGIDQLKIVFDVGLLLNQPPSCIPGTLNASTRLAFGFSASTAPLQTALDHPVLRSAFSASFDGAMLAAPVRVNQPFVSLQGLPAGLGGSGGGSDVKTIVVMTETELQLLDGKAMRGQSSNYRSYEIAGAAHNPTNLVPLGPLTGLPGVSATVRQNPMAMGQVLRAMMNQLRTWTLGNGVPPPSVELGNPFNTHNRTDFSTAFAGVEKIMDVPRSAADGHALYGIRLPPIEAPIGLHTGTETIAGMPFSATTIGQRLSGTFDVYSGPVLAALYPDHDAYVQAVATAAFAAHAAGWILDYDRDAYIATAAASAVGTGVALTEAQILACFAL